LTIFDTDPATPSGQSTVSPSHTWPGIWVGRYVGLYNLDNSSGDITFYSIAIEEVNSLNGSFERTILSPAEEFTVSGSVSLLANLAFNEANVPAIGTPVNWSGGVNFFNDKVDHHYKVTITVGNACGSSSDYSYIRINDRNYRMAHDLEASNSEAPAFP